jgi:hypothetical protein
MIAGTSTGGIIACGLSHPGKALSADTLAKFYKEHGSRIFDSPWASLGGVIDERYSAESLEQTIRTLLSGNLSDVTRNDLLVTSYEIERRLPFIFKSWKARGFELLPPELASSNDFQIADVARATSAAPTFFKPARINNADGKPFTLIDGGVYANNPAMAAYVAARRLYPLAEEYVIVSLGTGELVKPFPYDKAKDWGFFGWARPLLDIMFDGVSSTTNYELEQLLPEVSLHRFQTSLGTASEEMDNVTPENLLELITAGENTSKRFETQIATVMTLLRQPMTSRADLGYPRQGSNAPAPAVMANPGITTEVKRVIPSGPSDGGTGELAIKGIGTAAGATAGFAVGGPVGAVIGAGVGFLAGKTFTS